MIWISLNKWVIASNVLFIAERIYVGEKWTPFCKIGFAYKPWHFRLLNNIFKDSMRWLAVPDFSIKFHLFKKRKFKNMEEIEKHVTGFMLPKAK